jgi:hypothetical protein
MNAPRSIPARARLKWDAAQSERLIGDCGLGIGQVVYAPMLLAERAEGLFTRPAIDGQVFSRIEGIVE